MATKSEEVTLLLKRDSYPSGASQPDTAEICCIESSTLARVPLIGTLCRKRKPEDKVEIAPLALLWIPYNIIICRLDTIENTGNNTISQHQLRTYSCSCVPWLLKCCICVWLQGHFTSSIGVLLTMMGSVVGTGNIWRFPRILANNATEGGRP